MTTRAVRFDEPARAAVSEAIAPVAAGATRQPDASARKTAQMPSAAIPPTFQLAERPWVDHSCASLASMSSSQHGRALNACLADCMALLVKAKAKRWSPTLRFTGVELSLLDAVPAIALEVVDGLAAHMQACLVQPVADVAEVARETQLIEAHGAAATSPLSALADLHHDGSVLSDGLASVVAGRGQGVIGPLEAGIGRLADWLEALETHAVGIPPRDHLHAGRKAVAEQPFRRGEGGVHV